MEVKDKILETALHLFFRFGIKAITMDDIAKEMGISKKTIYRFFNEKDDIINALMEENIKKNQQMLEEIAQQANDPIHEMILMSQYMEKRYAEINPVFFHDLLKQHSKAGEQLGKFKKECVFKNLKLNIAEGIKQGLYRSDLDINFAAQYRVIQIDAMMNKNIEFDSTHFGKINSLITEIFMHGISTVKGHKLINKYKNKNEEE
jgi:AcrR family transcriptional regulator